MSTAKYSRESEGAATGNVARDDSSCYKAKASHKKVEGGSSLRVLHGRRSLLETENEDEKR